MDAFTLSLNPIFDSYALHFTIWQLSTPASKRKDLMSYLSLKIKAQTLVSSRYCFISRNCNDSFSAKYFIAHVISSTDKESKTFSKWFLCNDIAILIILHVLCGQR